MEKTKVLGLDFGNVIKPIGQPEMMWGFKEALPKLKEKFGERIHLISRVNNDEGAKKAKAFLEDHGLIGPNGFPPENLHFCLLRSEKGPIAEKLGITHFVDDRTEVLSHMKTVEKRYALNPTDRQVKEFPPDGMEVVLHWYELVEKLLSN